MDKAKTPDGWWQRPTMLLHDAELLRRLLDQRLQHGGQPVRVVGAKSGVGYSRLGRELKRLRWMAAVGTGLPQIDRDLAQMFVAAWDSVRPRGGEPYRSIGTGDAKRVRDAIKGALAEAGRPATPPV